MTPAVITWHDAAQTIIRTEYSGAWTWDDFHTTLDAAVEMMHSVNGRVDLIVAPQPNSVMPRGSAEPHLKRAIQVMPDNLGIQIIVTRSMLSKTMASIFTKVFSRGPYHDRLFFAANVDEANRIIQKDRARSVAKMGA